MEEMLIGQVKSCYAGAMDERANNFVIKIHYHQLLSGYH